MATIKTTGSGAELRVITQTVEGQARVSCECCGPCSSLPSTVELIFSGIQRCSSAYTYPLPSGLYTLTLLENPSRTLYDPYIWEYNSEDFFIQFACNLGLPRFTVTAYWTGDLIFAVFLGYLGEEENVAYPSVYTIENCDGTPEDSTAYGGVVSFEFVE